MASPTFRKASDQSHFPREHEAHELLSSSQLMELMDSKLTFHPDEPTKENASFSLSFQPSEVKASHNPLYFSATVAHPLALQMQIKP